MSLLPEEIEAHYLQAKESERLTGPIGELERLRKQTILCSASSSTARGTDVGGAAGVYAFPLAQQGHDVHLIDPVELHLEQARSHRAPSGARLKSITRGDARRLDVPSESADSVLLFGPLYHLTDPADRFLALREARRILRPKGVLFATGISRFALH